jgi:hypothetical protein
MFYLPNINLSTPILALTNSLAKLTYYYDIGFKGVFISYFSLDLSFPGAAVGSLIENKTTLPECFPKAESKQLRTE